MLLNELEEAQDVRGWLCSEKLDGWRCLWNGAQLYTRHGRILSAPEWFVATLPVATLDGELYAGMEGCGAVVSAIQRDDWSGLSFHAFDAPLHFGAFKYRIQYVEKMCEGTTAHFVPHTPVADYAEARQRAREIVWRGGEGVVLRNPHGLYKAGCRSQDVLKFKPFRNLDTSDIEDGNAGSKCKL